MPITNYAIVNQKVGCARALLRLINDLPTPLPTNQRTLQIGLLQGAVFHLAYAYRFYLREIAENHQVPAHAHAHIKNEDQLLVAFKSAGNMPPEAIELSSLRQDPNSWLAKMQQTYAAIGQLPAKKDKSPAETSHDHLIAVVSVDSEDSAAEALTKQQVSVWEKAFTDLIFRQREVGAEY